MRSSTISKIIVGAIAFIGLFQVTDQYRKFEKNREIARASYSALATYRAMIESKNLVARDALARLLVSEYRLAAEAPQISEVEGQLSEYLPEKPALVFHYDDVFYTNNCSTMLVHTFEAPRIRDRRYVISSMYDEPSVEIAVWPYPVCALPRFYPRSVVLQSGQVLGFYFDKDVAEKLKIGRFIGICDGVDQCMRVERFFPENTWIGVAESNILTVSSINEYNIAFLGLGDITDRLRSLTGRDNVLDVQLETIEASLRDGVHPGRTVEKAPPVLEG
jgi:hypothetical protein